MHFSTALVAGTASILQASAFLVPLDVDTAAVTAADFPHASFWSSATQIYELDCPGCLFSTEGEASEYVENRIHLEFRIDEQQRLCINDVATFPFPSLVLPPRADITVYQVRASDLAASEPVAVGFALEVSRVDLEDDEAYKNLIEAKFTILHLNHVPVQVDTVKIDLLGMMTESGRTLSIAKLSSVPFSETPGAEECNGSLIWSLCRLRAIIAARLQEMIEGAKQRASTLKDWVKKPGCHGKKFGKHGQTEQPEHQNEEPSEHPHEHHHQHHMHRHHMLHRFGHMLHQAIRFFIVPALLGVIGGLMASAVGMLVGQLIVYTWFRFHRNGQRGHVRLMEVAVAEEEKDGLMDEPPHYEDVEIVVVEERKQ